MHHRTPAVVALAVLGCHAAQPDRGTEPDTTARGAGDSVVRSAPRATVGAESNGRSARSSIAAADPVVRTASPWYRRVRALDLTGDGQLDSARLETSGARPDSLQITLTLVVGGRARHREAWGSSYELARSDSSLRRGASVGTLLRARLDSVLASVTVERLDAPDVRLMAEDRAMLDSLEPRPTRRISFSYGYETTVRLVWDAPRRRFVRLWSCC